MTTATSERTRPDTFLPGIGWASETGAADSFREAWHAADAEGRSGERVTDGLRAATAPVRSLLARLRAELDEVLVEPHDDRTEYDLALELDGILREAGVL
ncbi:hypothetical protein SEA_BARNSTORMER_66 [Microbacterium phage Barnstormer]|uniref:Uncharacterized protein n=1 Tax=Microbacterium phage Barnstormer TaxID=3028491 RepID=A0AAE9ZKB0_9CAUD|nr:hypothetical protein SEA_BARNSTORMER_66 [Microbacterium phage Barnstormer]